MNGMGYEVVLADNCGFCFGVRRAVELVYDLRKKTDKKILVIGELIHNGSFIERLKKDGIYCIDEKELDTLLPCKDDVVVVIRTHGITRELAARLDEQGFITVDATCPFVKRIHGIVDKNSRSCDTTIIIGDKNHPEVIGIRSYAHSPTAVYSDDKECFDLVNKDVSKKNEKVLLVSQTTGNNEKYVNCQKIIKKVYTKAKIFDTICSVTENRQNEVTRIAANADIMCVIGGAKSSNTRKLYEIALQSCRNVYLLETASDVPEEDFRLLYGVYAKNFTGRENGHQFTVGITAGASTPDDILEEVKVRIEETLKALCSGEKQKDGHIIDQRRHEL